MLSSFSARFDRERHATAIRLPAGMRLSLIACALAIGIGTVAASATQTEFIATHGEPLFVWLTAYLFQTQDMFWLAMMAILLFGLAISPLPAKTAGVVKFIARRPRTVLVALVACVLVMGVVGTHVVFDGYNLTRDEFLADFDSIIFRAGKITAPIAADWRPFASALAPRFMLSIAKNAGFASIYLPVNAALRALVGLIGDPSWTNPLLAASAILATFGVARRLWPTHLDVAVISALLVATSSQVLVTSMTSYAMTAHLALNMIWLWFFLRDDKIGHGAAITTGFLASGLHELIFHLLFAAPFIVRLWASRRQRLALIYIASYSAICLFWIDYWKVMLAWQGITGPVSDNAGPLYFAARVMRLLQDFRWTGSDLMLKNVLRFVAWQSPALLPLGVLAYPAIRRDAGIARELLAGLLLTLVALFILQPYQGHGWGYRYLHGLIGSAALLGGYGWIALSNRISREEAGATSTAFVICSAIAWFVLLPVHAMQAHDFVTPYARAMKAIKNAPTDVVIVDESGLLFAEDLVRNDPFLRNRPKVLALSNLTKAEIEHLCTHYSVATFDYTQALAFGIMPNNQATKFGDPARANLRMALSRRACGAESVVHAEGEGRSRR